MQEGSIGTNGKKFYMEIYSGIIFNANWTWEPTFCYYVKKENIFNSDKGRKNMDLWRHYHDSLIAYSLLLDTLEGCNSPLFTVWLDHVICFGHDRLAEVTGIVLSLRELITCLCMVFHHNLPVAAIVQTHFDT